MVHVFPVRVDTQWFGAEGKRMDVHVWMAVRFVKLLDFKGECMFI
jgi:hypothetical protein